MINQITKETLSTENIRDWGATSTLATEEILSTADYRVKTMIILDDLQSPWSLVKLPTPDEFLISQRAGTLIKVNVKTFQKTFILAYQKLSSRIQVAC